MLEMESIGQSGAKSNPGRWHRVKGSLNDYVQSFTRVDKNNCLIVRASVSVHSSAEVCLAYLWHFASSNRTKKHKQAHGNASRYVSPAEEQHSNSVLCTEVVKTPFGPRLLNTRQTWGSQTNDRGDQTFKLGFASQDLSDAVVTQLASKKRK
jgi:hypothetical protein